jgi:hypothetical protein
VHDKHRVKAIYFLQGLEGVLAASHLLQVGHDHAGV